MDNNKEEYHERIDRYLLNQMSEAEKYHFKQDLEADEELLSTFKAAKYLIHGIENQQTKNSEFRDILQEIITEEQKQKHLLLKYPWFKIAASIIILLGLAIIWFFIRPSEGTKVYQQFAETTIYSNSELRLRSEVRPLNQAESFYKDQLLAIEKDSIESYVYLKFPISIEVDSIFKKDYAPKIILIIADLVPRKQEASRTKSTIGFLEKFKHLVKKEDEVAELYWNLSLAYAQLEEWEKTLLVLEEIPDSSKYSTSVVKLKQKIQEKR